MSESEQDYDFGDDIEQDELQEEVEQEDQEEQDEETSQAPEEKEEPVDSTFIDFDKIENEEVRKVVKARIDKEWREKKKQERELAEHQRKMRELEDQLTELKKPKEVKMPTQDDWYKDPEAAQRKQEAWAKAQEAQLEWNREKQERERRLADEQQKQVAERVQKYEQKVKLAGIDRQELGYAESVVAQSGISQEVANYLLDHPNGPQIVMHLAKNPIETQEIASLNLIQVGEKLNQLAAKFRPNRKSKAPPPDDPIRSTSAVKEESPWLKGAKFE